MPQKPKQKPPSPPSAAWISFYQAHPTPYVAIFATKLSVPGGLASAVKGVVAPMAQGAWATWSLTPGKVLIVGFADHTDFVQAKAHFSGKPWSPIIQGAIEGFQVII